MKKLQLITITLLFISTITLFQLQSSQNNHHNLSLTFQLWKIQFHKYYPSQSEHQYRLNIFIINQALINQHNQKYLKGQLTSKLSLNRFSDLTIQQFSNIYLSNTEIPTDDFACTGPQYPKKDSFNDSFITNPKMITSVQTQGQCISGYAFATSAAVQASMFKSAQSTVQMSTQQLIDCSKQFGNNGCDGGSPLNALHYLMNRGAMKAIDYSYIGKTDDCKYTPSKKIWEVQNCTKVDSDLSMLKSQILEQPVIVGFDASDMKFMAYASGIYMPSTNCGAKLNHYMLAVGWGVQIIGTTPLKKAYYYIMVKNSFGLGWGYSGYGKVAIQVDKTMTNGCGMLSSMYFPYG